MTINYQNAWKAMNELEQIIAKISNTSEIIDSATEAIEQNRPSKAVALNYAAHEHLELLLDQFDKTFKKAWSETIQKLNTNSPVESWAVKIEHDLVSDDLYINLPKSLCDSLNLDEGNRLTWELHSGSEDSWSIRKTI